MAQRHSGHARAHADFYTEEPWVPEWLFAHEPFEGPVLDPACGIGTIPLAAIEAGLKCRGSDLHDRGYGEAGNDWLDDRCPWRPLIRFPNVVCNPPHGRPLARRFVELALERVSQPAPGKPGGKVAMLLPLQWMAAPGRADWLLGTPLVRVWVITRRINFLANGVPIAPRQGKERADPSAHHAWYVWQAGAAHDPRLMLMGEPDELREQSGGGSVRRSAERVAG